MTKECLELIYSEIKEKSERMNTWKGTLKTKTGKIQEKYLKVLRIISMYNLYGPNNNHKKITNINSTVRLFTS